MAQNKKRVEVKVRLSEELWLRARKIAAAFDLSLNDVIVAAVRDYLGEGKRKSQ
jgi:hypothetical protein